MSIDGYSILVIAAVATVLSCASVGVVLPILKHTGIIDIPNARSSHVIPTPRGGGIALTIGLLAACLVAPAVGLRVPLQVVVVAASLALIGFIDDRRGLPASVRLGCQLSAGLLCGTLLGGVVGAAIGAVVFPVIINAVNFMDGINGISGSIGVVWGSSALIYGSFWDDDYIIFLGVATASVCLGFLPWNMPSAKIFLGDVGSYFLGALIAGGILLGSVGGGVVNTGATWVLLSPLCLYLVDTGGTILRRVRRGEKLSEAHREHVYQRLAAAEGMAHWQVSLLVAGASVLCAVLAYWPYTWVLIVVVCVLYASSPRILVRSKSDS